MKWNGLSDIKLSLKQVIGVVGFCVTIAGTWFSTQAEIKSLRSDVTKLVKANENFENEIEKLRDLNTDFQVLKGQLQFLLGESIKSGWTLPKGEWIFPYGQASEKKQ